MKDPAFLFYDGDAARDVSHMNRLERGAYFDLIQAQRKFGGYTVEQIRKILGKDFDEVWAALELILTKDENSIYFIEWVKNSIEKRKEHAEIQRKRIQDYWDKKRKENKIPINNDGNTAVLPLVNENEIENEIVNKDINKIPTYEDFEKYALEKKQNLDKSALKLKFDSWIVAGWKDGNGNKIKNWKSKLLNTIPYLKESNDILSVKSINPYNDLLKPEYR